MEKITMKYSVYNDAKMAGKDYIIDEARKMGDVLVVDDNDANKVIKVLSAIKKSK